MTCIHKWGRMVVCIVTQVPSDSSDLEKFKPGNTMLYTVMEN